MLALSGEGPFLDRLLSLRLRPVSISYEYEPCDAFIAREQYLTERTGTYAKSPGEDMRSIRHEVMGRKGGIHIEIGRSLDAALIAARALPNKNLQARSVSMAIDARVHADFRLWPSHYIAYDLLQTEARFADHYSVEKREEFCRRMEKSLDALAMPDQDRPGLRQHFLKLYASAVSDRLSPRGNEENTGDHS
jgi:hypothetical protein